MKFKKLFLCTLLLTSFPHYFYSQKPNSLIKETIHLGVNSTKLIAHMAGLGKHSCKLGLNILNNLLERITKGIKTIKSELKNCSPEEKQKLNALKTKLISIEADLVATLKKS